ncbi:TetR/AcrR family transcriptional regulator [Bacteroides sp. 224]|uniref:TetR/AcrR family transcriptional regulator n=1 Tax=Bacteroides sp. 224 TaxID=2302936 RepID=UPI0013D25BB8|nr:TetR/AcrR family transcriptional regulator [Bacteroides sp. 224]NDV64668.1 TetR/AcrR family transcriptional regulator [Bacteroides sp. 224]
MRNYDPNLYLSQAFKLFLLNNYEKVTVKDLERATGSSRGALFYRFKNKQEIFEAVIDKYVLHVHEHSNKFPDITTSSLKGFIDEYIEGIKTRMEIFLSMEIENMSRTYFSLIYQALHYYPNFGERADRVFQGETRMWNEVIQTSMKSGKIISTLDSEMLAHHFRQLYLGQSFEQSMLKGLDPETLKKQFYLIYDLIKKTE